MPTKNPKYQLKAQNGTFVYSPDIAVYIATQKAGTIDISKDIVRATLIRQTGQYGPSQFMADINNKRAKYDRVIERMCRIVVFLKRTHWLQEFSGYIDMAPYETVVPGDVQITATCTLKRLYNTYWDPHSTEAQALFPYFNVADWNTEDGGTASTLYRIMVNVAKWSKDQIWVQKIPQRWLDQAVALADQAKSDLDQTTLTAMQTLLNATWPGLDGSGSTSGKPTSGTGSGQGQGTGNGTGTGNGSGGGGGSGGGHTGSPGAPSNPALALIEFVNGDLNWNRMSVANHNYILNNIYQYALENPTEFGLTEPEVHQYRGASKGASKLVNLVCKRHYGQNCGIHAVGSNRPHPEKVSRLIIPNGEAPLNARTGGPRTAASGHGGHGQAGGQSPGGGGGGKRGGSGTGVQSFLDCLKKQIGDPYGWGDTGPSSFDCSGLGIYCCEQAGAKHMPPRTSLAMSTWFPKKSRANLQPGDFLFFYTPVHHVAYYIGNNRMISAPHTGANVQIAPVYWQYFRWGGDIGATGLTGTGTAAGGTGAAGGTQAGPAFGFEYWYPGTDAEGVFFSGNRAWINDEKMISTVDQVCSASMRSYQSAPNGDFIAWFPDKMGVYGKTPAVKVRDIEVLDFKLQISDDALTTHVAIAGDYYHDLAHVGVDLDWISTSGIVSVQQEEVMKILLGLDPTKQYQWLGGDWIMQRFGLRPYRQEIPEIRDHLWEFMLALHIFQENWSKQFISSPQFTFLPELYPGMRVELIEHNIGFYVDRVVHQMDREQGFTTQATVTSPMRRDKNGNWVMFPMERSPKELGDSVVPGASIGIGGDVTPTPKNKPRRN